ncbi:uncharacterized protein LOC8275149 isoform X2 [Ricinus communis]|uniref:uncharacterized protein LOC8275149 isoform X2 n=1 Tax=Ricinus communis TaxID=3988 RepID=UPI00201A2C1D|nr:uncharacterized protein LOC8275149 isoform X2 [Ricinus communis]
MASRKKPAEGIALLSMYADEDDEDLDHEQQQQEDDDNEYREPNETGPDAMVTDDLPSNEAVLNQNLTPKDGLLRSLTPQVPFSSSSPQLQQQQKRRSGRGRLTIVDYAHDEVAMSPEPDDGEFDEELQTASGEEKTPPGTVQILTPSVHATPQSSEHVETSQHDEMNDTVNQLEAAENEGTNNVPAENVDPLGKFLPPPPKEKCPEELRRKIDKFISLKKDGRSFNAEVRNRKDYRNPDFLLHAVRYQEIDQIGSCFSKDVFDPHGYDKSDFFDEIEADMRRERERKEQELKKSPKVEFISGGTQPGQVVPPSKFSMPIPGLKPSSLNVLLLLLVGCILHQMLLLGMVDRTRNQNGIRWMVILEILYQLVGRIHWPRWQPSPQYYLQLMLVLDTQLLCSRNGERQKKKDPVRRSWTEDLETHFSGRNSTAFRGRIKIALTIMGLMSSCTACRVLDRNSCTTSRKF